MVMVTASGPVTEAPLMLVAKAGPVRTEVACFSMLVCSALPSSGVPSWNTMFGPQRDGERREVVVRRDRLGQVRLDLPRCRHDGDGVEHGAPVEEAALVPAGRGGVEPALLGVDAHGERAAPLRLGRADPVLPGPLVCDCAGHAGIPEGPGHGRPGPQGQPARHERPPIK